MRINKEQKTMSPTAVAENLRQLKHSGFSEQQAEGLLQVTERQTKELLEAIQKQAKKTEPKVLTKEYLDMQIANINLQIAKLKISFLVQGIGMLFSGLVLLGWYINHLDNKSRAYVSAHFASQSTRFDAQDKRFDAQDKRFDKIESDLKEIKNFIFSHFPTKIKGTN